MSATLDRLLMLEMEYMDAYDMAAGNVVDDFIDADEGCAEDMIYDAMEDEDSTIYDECDPDYDNDPETGILDDPDFLDDDELIDQTTIEDINPGFYDIDDEDFIDDEGGEF